MSTQPPPLRRIREGSKECHSEGHSHAEGGPWSPIHKSDTPPKCRKSLVGANDCRTRRRLRCCDQHHLAMEDKSPGIYRDVQGGLEAANDCVELSMFERRWLHLPEHEVFMRAGAETPVYTPFLEHVPPDPRAGEFWLTNRAPDRWKNKQRIEHSEGH